MLNVLTGPYCFARTTSTSTTTTTSPAAGVALHEDNGSKLTAVNLNILRNLWLPDVEILNLKAFETHSVLSKLEGVWIDDRHQLLYALATRITFICPMKFNAFPMDIQRCKFQVRRQLLTYLLNGDRSWHLRHFLGTSFYIEFLQKRRSDILSFFLYDMLLERMSL